MHFTANMQKGSSGDGVKSFQVELKQLGYYIGKIDGIFGPVTDTAVRDFQYDYELTVDGIIGHITNSKIGEVMSSTATFQVGSRHFEIRTLQRQLKLLGLYPAEIDAIFGPITNSGVKSFQQSNGLMVDGIVGPDTKAALKKKLMGEQTNVNIGQNNAPGAGNDAELGKLSAKYESGGDPGSVSSGTGDYGGKSYGLWQFASRTGVLDDFLKWLAGKNKDYYDRLMHAKQQDGNKPGANFDKTWKSIAANDREGFFRLQRDFVKPNYYDAAAASLKDKHGFDINARSFALKEVLFSTAVQHGPRGAVSIFSSVNLKGNDEDIINGVYNERSNVKVYFRSSSPDVQNGVKQRFAQERQDALKLLKGQPLVLH